MDPITDFPGQYQTPLASSDSQKKEVLDDSFEKLLRSKVPSEELSKDIYEQMSSLVHDKDEAEFTESVLINFGAFATQNLSYLSNNMQEVDSIKSGSPALTYALAQGLESDYQSRPIHSSAVLKNEPYGQRSAAPILSMQDVRQNGKETLTSQFISLARGNRYQKTYLKVVKDENDQMKLYSRDYVGTGFTLRSIFSSVKEIFFNGTRVKGAGNAN